jgi:hypothetical protein
MQSQRNNTYAKSGERHNDGNTSAKGESYNNSEKKGNDNVLVTFDSNCYNVTLVGRFGPNVCLYTERNERPVANYCRSCDAEYYVVNKVLSVSVLNNEVCITRCPHSGDVRLCIKRAWKE